MSATRRDILEMLAAGKITAAEAEKLLDGAGAADATTPGSTPHDAPTRPRPRYLRVVVEGEAGAGKGKTGRVNVRVPLGLLRAGMKLARFLPEQARARVQQAMDQKGIPVDLNNLTPDAVEELIQQLSELSVDVEGGAGGQQQGTVRVFCE
jgi:hypothetical protein